MKKIFLRAAAFLSYGGGDVSAFGRAAHNESKSYFKLVETSAYFKGIFARKRDEAAALFTGDLHQNPMSCCIAFRLKLRLGKQSCYEPLP